MTLQERADEIIAQFKAVAEERGLPWIEPICEYEQDCVTVLWQRIYGKKESKKLSVLSVLFIESSYCYVVTLQRKEYGFAFEDEECTSALKLDNSDLSLADLLTAKQAWQWLTEGQA